MKRPKSSRSEMIARRQFSSISRDRITPRITGPIW